MDYRGRAVRQFEGARDLAPERLQLLHELPSCRLVLHGVGRLRIEDDLEGDGIAERSDDAADALRYLIASKPKPIGWAVA